MELGSKFTKKVGMKMILESEDHKKPNWTEKQLNWIENRIPIDKLFKHQTTNTTRIEDFRTKFLMNFWSKNRDFDCCVEKNILHFTFSMIAKK